MIYDYCNCYYYDVCKCVWVCVCVCACVVGVYSKLAAGTLLGLFTKSKFFLTNRSKPLRSISSKFFFTNRSNPLRSISSKFFFTNRSNPLRSISSKFLFWPPKDTPLKTIYNTQWIIIYTYYRINGATTCRKWSPIQYRKAYV